MKSNREGLMKTLIFLLLALVGMLFWNSGGWILYAISPLALCWPSRKPSDETDEAAAREL